MLQAMNVKPWVSANTCLNRQHDYYKMPLVPLSCHTMTHNTPETRTSWGSRANEHFHVSTLNEHYQCFKIWVKDAQSICISDTVHFHHNNITALSNNSKNDVIAAAKTQASPTINDRCQHHWDRTMGLTMPHQCLYNGDQWNNKHKANMNTINLHPTPTTTSIKSNQHPQCAKTSMNLWEQFWIRQQGNYWNIGNW